jgi:hypothetical protein
MLASLLLLGLAGALVTGNVEKVIFLGPPSINIPLQQPALPSLNLDTLTPEKSTIRTTLSRSFHTEESPGQTTWLVLDGLTEGQRYELRACWSAMVSITSMLKSLVKECALCLHSVEEPTAFDINTFDVEYVFATPELIQSLSEFAYSRIEAGADHKEPRLSSVDVTMDEDAEKTSSILFVRIITAADYYSDYVELMENPPPVLVDLILDPFLFNILPRSLLPTGGYIVCVAVVTWIVARYITLQVRFFAESSNISERKAQ